MVGINLEVLISAYRNLEVFGRLQQLFYFSHKTALARDGQHHDVNS